MPIDMNTNEEMMLNAASTTTGHRMAVKGGRRVATGNGSTRSLSPKAAKMNALRLSVVIACSVCLLACLMPIRQAEAGRLQDFIQNLVGGRDSSNSNKENSSSNNNNGNSNSNSNNDSNDSDGASNNDANDQQMTPMMSAMSPFMRYPSIYDSFGQAGFGGFPGMSFSNPMGAMSAMSPMSAMSSNSAFGGAMAPPSAFSPASFGSAFGSASTNPMSAFGGAANGMSASTLNNVYASSPSLMGGYTPYYGRRR